MDNPINNAQDLYQEIKDALDYFGLSFHQKDEVEVAFQDGMLLFKYRNRAIALDFNKVE